MKFTGSLVVALAAALLTSQSLIGAEPAKKPAASAAKKPAASAAKKPAAAAAKKPAAPAASKPAPAAATAAPAAAAPQIPEVVATVEGMEIKRADLDKALDEVMARNGGKAADIPPQNKLEAYYMVLDDLVVEKLLNKRAGEIKISDQEVSDTLKRITGDAPEAELKAQIEKSGRTVSSVRDDIRQSLRQQAWVEDQIKGKGAVTEAEVGEFYKQNPEQFKMPEQVRASHILISVPPEATPQQVIEKEKAAQAIAARVKKGEDFAALAKELSEDPSAKQNAGDLDFFTRERMVPEFSEAAFGMKVGEVSAPVRSKFGYHIIKVTDRKAPETVTLESAKTQLMAYLEQQKKQGEVEKVIRELREKADVKIHLPPPPPPVAAPAEAPANPAAPASPAAPGKPGTPAKQ